MILTGVDFVLQYDDLLDSLKESMGPEYQELIFRYRFIDPHDLVNPDDVFTNNSEMLHHLRIFIWIDHMEGDPINRN